MQSCYFEMSFWIDRNQQICVYYVIGNTNWRKALWSISDGAHFIL